MKSLCDMRFAIRVLRNAINKSFERARIPRFQDS